jgi:UDP-N-acetylglucosamine:LPS N-acetylglucosamine transferase
MIIQSALTPEALDRSVHSLLDDRSRLAERSAAVRTRARPNAAHDIAHDILELIKRN